MTRYFLSVMEEGKKSEERDVTYFFNRIQFFTLRMIGNLNLLTQTDVDEEKNEIQRQLFSQIQDLRELVDNGLLEKYILPPFASFTQRYKQERN